MATSAQDEQRLALFIDFENIAIGVRDAHYRKFDVNLVLERLLDKGKLLVKKAYADWSRYSDYKRSFHEAAIELIEVPQKSVGGKNSADIRLVVDAMDMSFQKEHINCFVVASGDSDFSPLVSKLKENNKYVIGLGVKNSTSDLLIENCDEFIFYEDLVRVQQRPIAVISNAPEKLQECFALLVDSVIALQRENKEILWGSMVKETMKRKKPSFNETYYGFRTFSHLLEDSQRRGIVVLRRDQRSGSYIIEDLGPAASVAGSRGDSATTSSASPSVAMLPAAPSASASATAASPAGAVSGEASADSAEGANGSRGRRRRGRGRRGRGPSSVAPGSFHDPNAPGGPIDDDDDDADDLGPEENEAASGDRGGPSDPHPADAPAERAPAASPASSSGAASAQDRGFSFFSWLRRDQPGGGEEERPPSDRKPDREG